MSRILFLRFPLESRLGGAELQTLSLMRGLAKRGHVVSFIGSCKTLLQAMSDERSAMSMEGLIIGNPPVTKWGAVSFLWKKRRMQKKLIEATSLLISQSPKPTVLFMLSITEKLLLTDWCVKHGMKVIWIEHDSVGRWLTRNPWLPRLRKLSRFATTVTVSNMSRDLYLKMGWRPEDIVAIPNGIDTERSEARSEKSEKQSVKREVLHIGCLARLTHDKGVDLLLEAIADLSDVRLTIVGTGREEKRIQTLINQTHFRASEHPNIPTASPTGWKPVLLPSVPNTRDFYSSLDVLVLPSRENDPFGLVVAEAMAAGVPVICTDACGIASHLDASEAMIVKAGSSYALREAIIRMKNSNVRAAFAKNGQQAAREKFSLERMVEAYERLL